MWEPGNELGCVLGQRRDTPGNEKWSGRWESNPRLKLGKLGYYHYTTPAPLLDSSRLSEDQATFSFWFGVADIPDIRQGSYGLANARLNYLTQSEKIELGASLENLTDKHYATMGFDNTGVNNMAQSYPGMPRWFKVHLNYKF